MNSHACYQYLVFSSSLKVKRKTERREYYIKNNAPVLRVDDAHDLRNLLELSLRREVFDSFVASNTTKTLTLTAVVTPKCILLDFMLPDMSGTELCRRFRSETGAEKVPIIMVMARTE